jgi:hypothetical protein
MIFRFPLQLRNRTKQRQQHRDPRPRVREWADEEVLEVLEVLEVPPGPLVLAAEVAGVEVEVEPVQPSGIMVRTVWLCVSHKF